MDVLPDGNVSVDGCPHLGLARDPACRCLFVSDDHRCYRWPRPVALAEAHQAAFCLSADHRRCLRLIRADDASSEARGSRMLFSSRGRVLGLIAILALALLLVALLLMSGQGLTMPGGES